MFGGEGVNLGRGGEVPGGICEFVPPDSIFRPDYVAPEGVAFFPVHNPHYQRLGDPGGGLSMVIYYLRLSVLM